MNNFTFEVASNLLVVKYWDNEIYYSTKDNNSIGNFMKAINYDVSFDKKSEILAGIATNEQIVNWYQLDTK
jgi:hypothetical protein